MPLMLVSLLVVPDPSAFCSVKSARRSTQFVGSAKTSLAESQRQDPEAVLTSDHFTLKIMFFSRQSPPIDGMLSLLWFHMIYLDINIQECAKKDITVKNCTVLNLDSQSADLLTRNGVSKAFHQCYWGLILRKLLKKRTMKLSSLHFSVQMNSIPCGSPLTAEMWDDETDV